MAVYPKKIYMTKMVSVFRFLNSAWYWNCSVLLTMRESNLKQSLEEEGRGQQNKTQAGAKGVINEWLTHSTYGFKKMSKHLKWLGYGWQEKSLSAIYTRNLKSKDRSLFSRRQEAEKRHTESFRNFYGSSSSHFLIRSWRWISFT